MDEPQGPYARVCAGKILLLVLPTRIREQQEKERNTKLKAERDKKWRGR